jgi:hypothetical protein
MARKPDNDLSLYRCPHCNSITLQAGDQSFELSREDFMQFRDMVNEIAMDLPDRCSIHNPKRFDFQQN